MVRRLLRRARRLLAPRTASPPDADPQPAASQSGPRIIPRSEHRISRANISEQALKVLYRLKKAGYQAFLVGGCVRDLQLGREPKDFDVATDARPEQVKELFRNCRLIGRRFRLAHVHFGRDNIIEVATFRAQHEAGEGEGVMREGRILRDNVYGDIDQDVWRRDFTINALYYDIGDFSIVDYVGGVEDLERGIIRTIGDPEVRFREDPVRMLRAVRFAVKLGFRIDPEAERQIQRLGHLLEEMPPARLFEEVQKLFLSGVALQTFEMLRHYDLFGYLFPEVEAVLAQEEEGFPHMLVIQALKNTDQRVAEGKPVTLAFLLAAFLWEALQARESELQAQGHAPMEALQLAAREVIGEQTRRVSIPRRISMFMKEVWTLQARLARRTGKRVWRTLAHPRFRAAYDFLVLRARVDDSLQELADWWTSFQAAVPEEQRRLVAALEKGDRPRRRRRRRRPAGGNGGEGAGESG
ncbi:MAG: polynucleotide adenylyltransferase PcnB [Gammaproteobacteria bacterium]|nr:MAG: polynucleotide adenylyltransferase PcnB [Gammaproteobacteria bacterium]